MKDKDYIKELFSEKLSNLEAEVRPELWNNVSSQIKNIKSSASTVKSFSGLFKAISFFVFASVAGITYFTFLSGKSSPPHKVKSTNSISNNDSLAKKIETTSIKNENKEKDLTRELQKGLLSLELLKTTNTNLEIIEEPTVFQDEEIKYTHLSQHEYVGSSVFEDDAPPLSKKNQSETQLKDQTLAIKDNESHEITLKQFSDQLDLPNIFTPNGDGVNDYFEIKSMGLSEFSIVILDSKSQVVFKSTDPDFKWDGKTVLGDDVPQSIYVYYLTALGQDGNKVSKHSMLTIKR